MKRLNGTEMKALFILSIVVPVGLLTTFRLTGILREQPKKERITLEPVTLTLSRPNETIAITNRSVQNRWTNGRSFIFMGIEIYSYHEKSGDSPYNNHDGLLFKSYVEASFEQGYVNAFKINFHPLDANAVLFVSQQRWDLNLENVTLATIHDSSVNETDAYIEAYPSSTKFSISDMIYWVYLDENESHELQMAVEVVHTSRTSEEVITIPVTLKMSLPEGGG